MDNETRIRQLEDELRSLRFKNGATRRRNQIVIELARLVGHRGANTRPAGEEAEHR